jgi:DHA1 family inner membrane transport protein
LLAIYLLAAAGFTVMTTEFMIVGLLPAVARDLQVTVPQAGLLVTLFAFTVAVSGPFLAALFGGVERKRLFVACLLLFAGANALAAAAPNIGVMAVARLLPALALPVFWSLASVSAVDLLGPEKSGKAISLLTLGIVCATVFGIPIGTLVADRFGWRSAFGLMALVALAKAAMLQAFFPVTRVQANKTSVLAQLAILRDPLMLGHVALSVLLFTAMFTSYTYLADMLEKIARFHGSLVGWTLMAFGAVGLVGNWLGGKLVDWHPLGGSMIFSALMAAGLLALVPSMHTQWGMLATLGAWGVAQAALFLVCHVRLMKAAPHASGFAASINISSANLGIGLGAIVGGRIIDGPGIAHLGTASAALIGVALVLTVLLAAQRRRTVREAAPAAHV